MESKIITLIGDINTSMLRQLMLDLQSVQHNPIEIHLCTPGGDIYVGFAIYDLLCKIHKVDIFVHGYCMSAGMIILQAADNRIAMPHAEFMTHYGEEESVSSPSEAKHNKRLFNRMKAIVGSKSKATKRTVSGWFSKDTYFSTSEALKAGLIDRIYDEKKEES